MKRKMFLLLTVLSTLIIGFSYYNSLCKAHFKQDGVLSLHKKNKEITNIKIEIAETRLERSTGLMNRKCLDKNNGMLFIFENSKKRSFWMKNTFIPLDIMYVNKEFKVVSIYEKTQPLLKKGLPSIYHTMYVIEVNAGFCESNNIKVGDSISYKRI